MPEFKEKCFQKGEVIYRQNEYETWMYDIRYGSVALYQNYGDDNEVLVKTYDGDGYFGELELIEARPRTTTAVAKEKTLVRVITSENFGALFEEKPAMLLSIMRQMSARIRELQRDYNDACRVVAESMAAEAAGKEKSGALQQERKKLSDLYQSYLRMLGGKQ